MSTRVLTSLVLPFKQTILAAVGRTDYMEEVVVMTDSKSHIAMAAIIQVRDDIGRVPGGTSGGGKKFLG